MKSNQISLKSTKRPLFQRNILQQTYFTIVPNSNFDVCHLSVKFPSFYSQFANMFAYTRINIIYKCRYTSQTNNISARPARTHSIQTRPIKYTISQTIIAITSNVKWSNCHQSPSLSFQQSSHKPKIKSLINCNAINVGIIGSI